MVRIKLNFINKMLQIEKMILLHCMVFNLLKPNNYNMKHGVSLQKYK